MKSIYAGKKIEYETSLRCVDLTRADSADEHYELRGEQRRIYGN